MVGRRGILSAAVGIATVTIAGAATHAAAKPSLRVSDVTVAETDARARLIVRLSRPAQRDIRVQYELRLHRSPGSPATAGTDYAAPPGRVRIREGKQRRAIDVSILDDNIDEYDEVIGVYVSKPGGTVLRDRQGVAAIVDDDPVPSVSIGDTGVVEGDEAEVEARFPLTLSNPTAKFPSPSIGASPHTGMGTATVRADYCCDFIFVRPIELTGPQAPGYASWPVYGDTDDEGDETFVMQLFPVDRSPFGLEPNVTIADGEAVGTIIDDD